MPTGKVGGLAPMHPDRLAIIDKLVGQTFTAGPKKNSLIAKQLIGLNLSPEEKQYVSQSSARRGNKAIAAQGEGVHGLVHHAFPTLARGALDVGALLTGAGVSQTPLRGAHGKTVLGSDGKPLLVNESTIGLPGAGLVKGVLGDVSKAKYPVGTLFHGSPEGVITKPDALYHTKMWREGPGFYLTSDAAKAAKYAAGKTAKADRVTGNGAVTAFRLKPGTKVLNLDAQPESFWRGMASKLIGEHVDEKRWQEWASNIPSGKASQGVTNRLRLLHFLTGYDEMPQTDAYYAIEEALHEQGVQATLHHENGIPVHVVKDSAALEHVPEPLGSRLASETGSFNPLGFLHSPVRTAEEALQHVREASQTAKAEGHGALGSGGRGNAPILKPGEVTAETGGALGAEVRTGLKDAGQVRAKQDVLYSEERSLRASAAEAAMKRGGTAGYLEALHQLGGDLPKEFFGNLKHLTQSDLDTLLTHVQRHPGLRTYEKVSTMDAITKAVSDGIVPTKSDQALLERVFGKEAQPVKDSLKTAAYWKQLGVDVLNVPRAVMASTDLSAPLRQGLVYGVSHPVMFAKTFTPMLKAAAKEGYFQKAIQDEIHDRPTFPLMEKAKVAFTDIGKDAKHGAESLGQREEARMSNLAERIPVWGHVIRGSDRAYVGFLNKARADYFDSLVHSAAKQGLDVNDEKLLLSIGKVINTATGRGNVPKVLEDHLATMNAFFFSPRLLASRINMLNPIYYARLDPFARRQALRNLAALGGTALTVLELARLGGAKVNSDPRNADFGKIRIGKTRMDILGGFQQPIRLGAQLYTGTIISSTTGRKIKLAGGFANTSRYDVVMRFLQSKASPVPSALIDLLKGQTFGGQPLSWKTEVVQRSTPLLAQDIWDLYHTPGSGGLQAIPEAGLGVLGVGVQSYAPKASESSPGANIFDQPSSPAPTNIFDK